ncbi:DUF1129 family protein [Oceanobacillus chungangensis]|uniref:DUF1129 domain-containing protein n=1 Tax=Oceanobacillus chungangensis TaxID=1229152 RepID=A0A3D8PG61_9BACI|nr:DUF1129 family protein [Oceanobacillus chungangensis]RDW15064.1 DUF1129 domain-containing protein [Oceanobacillus chungangensis]
MNPKDIVQLNNDKRKMLHEENLAYYEDMLIYIRLNANKSEQQTEEVLLELLEHLLHAQTEGKTAKDVFGDDLKAYCDEVIEEIPSEQTKDTAKLLSFIVIQFLAIISLCHGIISFGLNYFFDLGSNFITFQLGSGVIIILGYLISLYLFIKIIMKWMKQTSFKKKKTKPWVEFLQVWIISMVFIGVFILIPIITPGFGTTISLPILTFAVIGAVLYLISFILNKMYRITA